MNISYLTNYNAQDVHQWSGLGYYIAKSIEKQNVELSYISNLYESKINIYLAKKLFYMGLGKKYLADREPQIAHDIARKAEKLIGKSTDLIFSPGSQAISYLNSNKPKAFYTDATFASMLGFYKSFTGLSEETIKNGHMLEKAALDNCDLAIYASTWAAESAIKDYGANPNKVKVVPFGANLEHNYNLNDIKAIINNKPLNKCDLLFVGVEWERKGGPLALNVTQQLNEMGIPTTLHIVGLPNLPIKQIPSYVKNYGFISKKTASGKKQLDNLFTKSHFLIVPSIAEAYGLVFCEANSFGLPALATDVGGIPTIIKNNINGQVFNINSGSENYAKYIYDTLNNSNVYKDLCFSSYNRYEQELNWNVAGKSLVQHFKQLI